MRLTRLKHIISEAFESAGYVNGIYFGDVYELWNNEQVHYVAACATLDQVQSVGQLKEYRFTFYAADKLLDDEVNKTHALDYAEGALDAAMMYIDNHDEVLEVESDRVYTPFVQKFADTLAGYWVDVTIRVQPDMGICE